MSLSRLSNGEVAEAAYGAAKSIEGEDWREMLADGQRLGGSDAVVEVLTFSDFQCPACRRFAVTVQTAREIWPGRIGLVYRHLPLPYHAKAFDLAVASECAAQQARSEEYYLETFAAQEPLDVITPLELAARVGNVNLADFASCVVNDRSRHLVERDMLAASALGVTATPTVYINGRLVTGVADSTRFQTLMKEYIARKER